MPSAGWVGAEEDVDLVVEDGVEDEGVDEEEVGVLEDPASGVAESFEVFSAGEAEGVPLGTSDFRDCSSFFISDFASFFSFTPLIKDLTPETVFPRELSS
jgi:hypothetical protein